ncbi:MAG: preprotein translocase subunit SecG [Bacteroidia bacterium]|nr:preprotein translocase subunit SecG [Bacteroidia bacterium]
MGVVAVLIILISILLTLVVLIQNSKGGGIASNFASNTQVVGVKKQAEYIEKVTWGLMIALMILCVSAGVGSKGAIERKTTDSKVKEGSVKTPVPSVNPPGISSPTVPPPSTGTP